MERIMQIANGVAIAIIIGAGGWMVLAGKLSLGGLTICASYIVQLLKPIEKINDLASSVARGVIRGEHLVQLLSYEAEVNESENPLPLAKTPASGQIELCDVSFSYIDRSQTDSQRCVFDRVNLKIQPGSFTILEGPSGSGKSTLLNLLLRLIDPQHGNLLLDGIPYMQLKLTSLRNQFAVMLQDSHFFSGSIREVLQPTCVDISDSDIWQALDDVDLMYFVRRLPAGLDTPLGECASNLSGGQRARLSLARALLMKRPILLLDEPLANVDEKSQQVILTALKKLKGKQTCLAVSHQPALRQCATRVIHLTNGHFIEVTPNSTAEPEITHGK
jgi:ABC-type multidrug transport system fused ATPase/permease subunit